MSTLAAATQPASQPVSSPDDVPWIALWIIFAFLGTITAGLFTAAYFLGAFRSGIQGPPRITHGHPVWPVAIGLLAAIGGLLAGGLIGYLLLEVQSPGSLAEELPRPPSDVIQADDPEEPLEMVRMMQVSAASYAGATGAALLTLVIARIAGWSGGIGLGAAGLGRGLITGTLGLILVIPAMLTAAIGLQIVRKALGYSLDAAHELIRALQEHPEAQMILWGILSAVVIAPLAEEILFRGFLQTTLVYGLGWAFGPHEARGFTPVMEFEEPLEAQTLAAQPAGDHGATSGTPPPPARAPYAAGAGGNAAPFPPAAVWRWTGIVVTSVIFAVLHEAWSIPLIFVLSLALGYVYERTGSLWAPIVVHFGFNTVNLMLVLPSILYG
jgi:membrane protease YdiL (CAAX protease family)